MDGETTVGDDKRWELGSLTWTSCHARASAHCRGAKATSGGRRKLAQNMRFAGATSRTS